MFYHGLNEQKGGVSGVVRCSSNRSPLPPVFISSPSTFRMTLTRRSFESPCMRQQQGQRPEDIKTDAARGLSQRRCVVLQNTQDYTVPQSYAGGGGCTIQISLFCGQRVKC